ncbi:MAG: hypothetical protein R3A13_08525 [Bdellovibrionota bacterium]
MISLGFLKSSADGSLGLKDEELPELGTLMFTFSQCVTEVKRVNQAFVDDMSTEAAKSLGEGD